MDDEQQEYLIVRNDGDGKGVYIDIRLMGKGEATETPDVICTLAQMRAPLAPGGHAVHFRKSATPNTIADKAAQPDVSIGRLWHNYNPAGSVNGRGIYAVARVCISNAGCVAEYRKLMP